MSPRLDDADYISPSASKKLINYCNDCRTANFSAFRRLSLQPSKCQFSDSTGDIGCSNHVAFLVVEHFDVLEYVATSILTRAAAISLFSNWKTLSAKAEPGLHASPWEYIEWVMQDLARLPSIVQQFKTELPPYLESMHERWRQLRLIRVPDMVDIELYRNDSGQHLIGSVEGRQLSQGQRNTAILNLLLVRGVGPIIIDQPEDEVDTSFIYRDLVPLLKQAKNQRQLILATHNANLPVNADSEFVYALKSEQGVGRLLAQGGTDRKATATVILDIMEGSEEAFKRRFEKYHF